MVPESLAPVTMRRSSESLTPVSSFALTPNRRKVALAR